MWKCLDFDQRSYSATNIEPSGTVIDFEKNFTVKI